LEDLSLREMSWLDGERAQRKGTRTALACLGQSQKGLLVSLGQLHGSKLAQIEGIGVLGDSLCTGRIRVDSFEHRNEPIGLLSTPGQRDVAKTFAISIGTNTGECLRELRSGQSQRGHDLERQLALGNVNSHGLEQPGYQAGTTLRPTAKRSDGDI